MTASKLIVDTEETAGLFSSLGIAPHTFLTFGKQDGQEIMRLDKEGMTFMGVRITDAGEAYAAWMQTMAMMQGKMK